MTCSSQSPGPVIRRAAPPDGHSSTEELLDRLPNDPFAELYLQSRFGRMATEALLLVI